MGEEGTMYLSNQENGGKSGDIYSKMNVFWIETVPKRESLSSPQAL